MAFRVMWLQYKASRFFRTMSVIVDIIVRWMLAFCAGGWAVVFLMMLSDGSHTITEPNKVMVIFELVVAVFLTLCGVIVSLNRTKYIK